MILFSIDHCLTISTFKTAIWLYRGLIVYLEAIELLSDKKRSVEQYTSVGGTAPEATRKDIAKIRQLIDCHFNLE